MANFKPVIRKGELNSANEANIKIRVSHKSKVRYISTPYYTNPDHMQPDGYLKKSHPNHTLLNLKIEQKIVDLRVRMVNLGDRGERMNIKDLLTCLKSEQGVTDFKFFEFTDQVIDKFKKDKSTSSARLYSQTKIMLLKFVPITGLEFSTIDYKFLQEFEEFLRYEQGNKINSIAIHMRNIRSIFNKAIDIGIIDIGIYPFRRYKIKKQITAKRNISAMELAKIRDVELRSGTTIERARDLFMLIFYLIGINMIDLVHITKISRGRIDYIRSKTKRNYSVKVYPEAKKIIDKYRGEKFLLDFIERVKEYRYVNKIHNEHLKSLAELCEIDEPLSFYYARHSWATIASKLDIPKDVISHALGHGNNTVTDVYIDFDLKKVDQANRKVIDYINSLEEEKPNRN